MRYGIKTHGVIYVGSPGWVARQAEANHGQPLDRGEPVPGGWARYVEPVSEDVLDLLRSDYTVTEEVK